MKRIGRGSTLAVMGMAALAASIGTLGGVGPALAERISNPVAEFAGIDKITGRITSFDVYIDETVQFGALQVTPKVCYSRDESEAQKIDAFVEVDEITLDRKIRRIFSGWMFADSPALNAVEHAIYDVWLTGCKQASDVPAPKGVKAAHPAPVPASETQSQAQQQPAEGTQPAEVQQPGGGQPPAASGQPQAAGEQGGTPPAETAPVAVPPLEAPQEIPADGTGEELPPLDLPPAGQDLPQEQPVPPAAVTKPGSVGLF